VRAVDDRGGGDQPAVISADESGPRHLARTLTRGHLEALVRDLVERTEAPAATP